MGSLEWDLPQAEAAIPRGLARDNARAQQHWADRACPQRRRVQDQHTLNASVGHHQLPDGHSEALDEERHVLVHLWFAEGGLKACVPTWEAVSGLPACFGRRLVGSIGAAHHMNGRPMVFCEAKRGDGGHQPTKRRALFVDCCRKPARQRAVLQQDQERCSHAERRGIQLLIQQLDREYIFWERHAPWRAGRFPVKHVQSSGGRGGWREGHPRLHRLSTNNVPLRE